MTNENKTTQEQKSICSLCKEEKHIVVCDAFGSYQLCKECDEKQTLKEYERKAKEWKANPQRLKKVYELQARIKNSDKERHKELYAYNLKILELLTK